MEINLQNYNLDTTLLGGQAFSWDLTNENEFTGFFKEGIIRIIKKEDKLKVKSSFELTEKDFASYLNINENYEKDLKLIFDKDDHIKNAINKNEGLRLLLQDPIQTTLSFILTSHKNIKAVRKVVRDLSKKYGEKIIFEGKEYYTFPTLEKFKKATESDLINLGLGFRAPYFKHAVDRLISEKINRNDFKNSQELKQFLLEFKGIGEKIADCITVFGFGFYDVTPLDIWAKRVITDLYKVEIRDNYKEMSTWYSQKFGPQTALAGQFLFEYVRVMR